MRNPPANVQPGVMAPAPITQSVVIPGQEPLTASMLAAAPPQEQKQVCKNKMCNFAGFQDLLDCAWTNAFIQAAG